MCESPRQMVPDAIHICAEVSEARESFPSRPHWGILYNWEKSHQTNVCPAVSMCRLEQG